jgi:hypothetical protein
LISSLISSYQTGTKQWSPWIRKRRKEKPRPDGPGKLPWQATETTGRAPHFRRESGLATATEPEGARMDNNSQNRLMNEPAYSFAQILVLRGLVLRLAERLMDRDEFADMALHVVDTLRIAGEPRPVPEAILRSFDDFERWVKAATA